MFVNMPEPVLGDSLGYADDYRFLALTLKSFAAVSALRWGKALHGTALKAGHLSCHSVSKAVLNMYAKCRALSDSHKLFGEIGCQCDQDPVFWNILLSGFASSRAHDAETQTLTLFKSMHAATQPKPSSVTLAVLLPVCARFGDVGVGRSVHGYAVKSGLENHTLVGNALVSMYAKFGLMGGDACAAFDRIVEKDVVSWNAIIAGFSENKLMTDAFRWFCLMQEGGVKPNGATVANIMPVCASLDKTIAYRFGKEIHGYVIRRNELSEDVSVWNALVSFYLRVGKVEEAELLFWRMASRDLVSWNAIVAGYASNGEWSKALELFHKLLRLETVEPDHVTFVSILPACAQVKTLGLGREMHAYILRRPFLCEDTSVGNALVSFYAKCSEIEAAYLTFSMIPERDLISWNSMLDAFSVCGFGTLFLESLQSMFREGIQPDSITVLTILQYCASVCRVDKVKEVHCYSIRHDLLLYHAEPKIGNAILDAYSKCDHISYAFKVFQGLSEKKNLVSFNSMISGYVNSGLYNDANMIFNEMLVTDLTTWNLMVRAYAANNRPAQAFNLFREQQGQGMKPDAVTIMGLLPACAQTASIQLAKQCHAYVVRSGFVDIHLEGALLDVYAKCGSIGYAFKLFESNQDKDLVIFTAIIGGYAMHGMGEEALRLFSHMLELGVKPDHVIITTILSACRHAGLVDEGLKIFHSIAEVHRMKPTMEQYSCAVDLLARAGRIDDAYSFVCGMPVEASANVWGTLLSACRTHHKVELGRVVAEHLLKIEADDIGNYVVLSNLYAAEARWDDVMEIRKQMRMRDVKKPAGCSWIEVERRKNVFLAGDCSQPQIVYNILNTLYHQIKDPFQLHLQLGLRFLECH